MALTAQKATAWKKQIESEFENQSVYGPALTNNHYEGELKANATLKIVSIGDVSESAYSGAWTAGDWADLATTSQDFTLDQKRKFLFKVVDTDQAQSMLTLLQEGARKAAYTMVNTKDAYLASFHSSITTNVYGDDTTPITVGFDSAAGNVRPSVAMSQLYTMLASSNSNQDSVNVVVPVWLAQMIIIEQSARGTSLGDASVNKGVNTGLLSGVSVGGFANIYVSNNVPDTTVGSLSTLAKVMAGSPSHSITTASVIENVETLRLELDFATGVRGLWYYGAKVPFQQHMSLGTFNQGSLVTT
jgi:hypothetical protein